LCIDHPEVQALIPRLPDRRTFLNDDDDGGSVHDRSKADLFGQVALLLFKPYRSLTSVGAADSLVSCGIRTWLGEYDAWRAHVDSAPARSYCDVVALAFIANAHAYHEGKQRARESTDRRAAEMRDRFGDVVGANDESGDDDDDAGARRRQRRRGRDDANHDDDEAGNSLADGAHLLDDDNADVDGFGACLRSAPHDDMSAPISSVAPMLATSAFAPPPVTSGAGMARVHVDVRALSTAIGDAERQRGSCVSIGGDSDDDEHDDESARAATLSTSRGVGGGGRVTVEMLEAALRQRRWRRQRRQSVEPPTSTTTTTATTTVGVGDASRLSLGSCCKTLPTVSHSATPRRCRSCCSCCTASAAQASRA